MGDDVLRQKGRGRTRIIRTDGGRSVTHGDVMRGLMKNEGVRVAVQDGRRPSHVLCETCPRTIKVGRGGTIPTMCPRCRGNRDFQRAHDAYLLRTGAMSPVCGDRVHVDVAARAIRAELDRMIADVGRLDQDDERRVSIADVLRVVSMPHANRSGS